jgi:hypothetical protein
MPGQKRVRSVVQEAGIATSPLNCPMIMPVSDSSGIFPEAAPVVPSASSSRSSAGRSIGSRTTLIIAIVGGILAALVASVLILITRTLRKKRPVSVKVEVCLPGHSCGHLMGPAGAGLPQGPSVLLCT